MLASETRWQHPVAWPWRKVTSNRRCSLFQVQPSDRRRTWVTVISIFSYAASKLGRNSANTLRGHAAAQEGASFVAQIADAASYDLIDVCVRGGEHCIKVKRRIDKDGVMKRLPCPPPILLLHDGPGLPSRYLEPLEARLCTNGRTCYMYDQLGCGMSSSDLTDLRSDDLQGMVRDFNEVMAFLKHSLGEEQVHLVAHGAGGAIVMESLVRHRCGREDLPKPRSVCLLGVSTSTALADRAAETLMAAAARSVGANEAARAFWFRHVCAMKPQPGCLADAYQHSFGRRWGALRGFERTDPGRAHGWQLRGAGALEAWSLSEEELETAGTTDTFRNLPVLSLRGQHDFVTEECVQAWRALGRPEGGAKFTESVLGGCGHNGHLEAPDSMAATLRLWLLDTEAPPRAAPQTAASAAQPLRPRADVKCRVLRRDEARCQLKAWASQLSWAMQSAPAQKPGAWRSVGQGLPHRDAFAPSRTCRRLADWAAQLPRCTHAGDEAISLKEILAEPSTVSGGPVALALMDGSTGSTVGIVCLEQKPLQIVGVARNPAGSRSLCDDAIDEIEAAMAAIESSASQGGRPAV